MIAAASSFVLLLAAQDLTPRQVPPAGIAVPADERASLEAGLARLNAALPPIEKHPLIADVLIFREAVRVALQYNEFFKPEEFAKARKLLETGMSRAAALSKGDAPWTRETGLVVRGYRSTVDDSIQPYGLVIPASWSAQSRGKWRLDAWFHGRSETLSELNFIDERMRRPGEFTPRDTFVLHLYGRYCNANKFAGEVDLFEALADVRKNYAIDEDRTLVRGFSMGGAATWHIAAHHAGLWAAAAPGAGFAETAEYQKLNLADFSDWERKLFQLYDATTYALNFFNLPLIAYSGEIDKQKQAADIMDRYLAKEGMRLSHVIGPKTEHKYHPDSKIEIEKRLDAIAAKGRDPYPEEIRFTTPTLRYNKMKWLTVDGLGEHWVPARVVAKRVSPSEVQITTSNVTSLTLDMVVPNVTIDGTRIAATSSGFEKVNGVWQAAKLPRPVNTLAKRHGLQGPIDDAFLSRFVFVAPTRTATHVEVSDRARAEMDRAKREWRKMFRGEVIERTDQTLTDADIASSNLVLWGGPSNNAVIAKLLPNLPIQWTEQSIQVRGRSFDSKTHMPVLIFPNPLNPAKYVVLNSGVTFREADYLTNSRQIARLPDWAVIDITVPADAKRPGRVAAAGFFDENWK